MIFQKGFEPIVKGIKQINDAGVSEPGEGGRGIPPPPHKHILKDQ